MFAMWRNRILNGTKTDLQGWLKNPLYFSIVSPKISDSK